MKTLILSNMGLIAAFGIGLLAVGQILKILYWARVEKLTARERVVKSSFDAILYDNEPGDYENAFIFSALWRLSDIYASGNALGYTLLLQDAVAIVAKIKREHEPERGINQVVIDTAVREFMESKRQNIPN